MQKDMTVRPSLLEGTVRVPLSKSLLHRALICSALAGDMSLADPGNGPLSDDITATRECLAAILPAAADKKLGRVFEDGDALDLYCGESGSTLRFLIPVVAALGIPAQFAGGGRLPQRPLGEYPALFAEKGVRTEYPGGGLYLPFLITGQLEPGVFRLPGNVSSQYISGLLFALPLLPGDSEIELTTPLESEPYVAMTCDVMRAFGVETVRHDKGYSVKGRQEYRRSVPYRSEPDFSQAAFWLTANYLGNHTKIEGLPESSMQGDSRIRPLLESLSGITARTSGNGGASGDGGASGTGNAPGEAQTFEINASQIPDLVPILSVAAAATPCTTVFTHAERLRLKECDRLEATCEMLAGLGVEVHMTDDGLAVTGRANRPGEPIFTSCTVNSYADHRMVMAAAIAATRADGPVRITSPHAVGKSYPDFFEQYMKVGGSADEFDVGE